MYVRSRTERAVARGQVVLAVSLDIANAFNTLPWECIMEALKFQRIPLCLRRLVESVAATLAAEEVTQIVGKIRSLGLEVALYKSQALCFHEPRKGPQRIARIVVDGVPIEVESTMRYLGLVLDSRWSFAEHFWQLILRLVLVLYCWCSWKITS
ncbi:unnamed protein product [Euphydryas editha]|uniref:Reverse transcriptase n=1 Tax=Euphydryas editha TaxID=104508 RepID=A0AAU9THU4_EUPED|nr:unnamed protein product [Euphydryas editha]